MQTRDHLALALWLLRSKDAADLHRYRRAFLFGCIEPDINPVTYLCGTLQGQAFHGHNAENRKTCTKRLLTALENGELVSTSDYFSLGVALHYIADAFTFPHNALFTGNLKEHLEYERELHAVFSEVLSDRNASGEQRYGTGIQQYFETEHEAYRTTPHGPVTDCGYILRVCPIVFEELLYRSTAAGFIACETGGAT